MGTKRVLIIKTLLISILLCVTAQAQTDDSLKTKSGTVTGVIGIQRVGPMMDGMVFFYDALSGPPPSTTKYWRIPTRVSTVDENARFLATLPAGKYYMAAIERLADGDRLSPPGEGDYFFILQEKDGKPKLLTVQDKTTIDLGMLNSAVAFKQTIPLPMKGITAIEGNLRTGSGSPLEGYLVLAYTAATRTGPPLFVSNRSDKNGHYLLRVAKGGTYYVSAVKNFDDTKKPGGLMQADKSGRQVAVKTGAVKKKTDIVVPVAGEITLQHR